MRRCRHCRRVATYRRRPQATFPAMLYPGPSVTVLPPAPVNSIAEHRYRQSSRNRKCLRAGAINDNTRRRRYCSGIADRTAGETSRSCRSKYPLQCGATFIMPMFRILPKNDDTCRTAMPAPERPAVIVPEFVTPPKNAETPEISNVPRWSGPSGAEITPEFVMPPPALEVPNWLTLLTRMPEFSC